MTKPNSLVTPSFKSLFQPARYKVYYGGRGSGKSWSIARALVAMADAAKLRILCAREFQTSMADSVHKLLSDQIENLGLSSRFTITINSIVSNVTGSEFIFKGLRRNINEIKSTEGVDICWVEEGQMVSNESWGILIPTIRKEGSEIWVSFNTGEDKDPTYSRFVLNSPPGAVVQKVNFDQNPYLPDTLKSEMEHCRSTDPEAYDHIWLGNPKKISEALIFKGKYKIDEFEEPEYGTRFFYGADWGFSQDPTALVRSFMKDRTLYISHEAGGIGIELDEIEHLFDSVPGVRQWPILADNARPETISHVRSKGFLISAADKWPGSVEDGIAHLRAFDQIIIHPRCKKTIEEFGLYSYKTDSKTGEVLPIIVDKWNHYIDAIRYSQNGYIQRKGVGVWSKLGKK